MQYDTLLVTFMSELDMLVSTIGDRFDILDAIHPDWADFVDDDLFDREYLPMYREMDEALDIYISLEHLILNI